MKFGMDDATMKRVDDLTAALERQAEANLRLAAAIEADVAAIGGVMPPPPAPADCCEHGAECTRTRR